MFNCNSTRWNSLNCVAICKRVGRLPLPGQIIEFKLVMINSWWRHQMETISALLALCAGNSPVTGEFPSQRPVTRNFDVFFDLGLNKPLRKQSRRWWFETPSCPLWRHCNVITYYDRVFHFWGTPDTHRQLKLVWWHQAIRNQHTDLTATAYPGAAS